MNPKTALLLFLVLFVSSAEAKIVFTKPFNTYNLGDRIEQQISLTSNTGFEGFFRVMLLCDGKEFLIFYSPVIIQPEKEKMIDLSFVHNVTGSCKFFATLEKEKVIENAFSESFLITDEIVLDLKLSKQYFFPGKNLEIEGKVHKRSGEPFTGKVDLFFFGKNFSTSVVKGEFFFRTEIPKNAKAGRNFCIVNVSDDFGNKGSAILEFDVASVPSSLVIELNNETLIPGTLLVVVPKLLDQSDTTIRENVSLRIFKVEDFLFFQKKELLIEKLVQSGASSFYRFGNFSEPGYYIIEAYSQGFRTTKIVYVLPVEKIDINLSGNILEVKNLGNVPYKKPLEIKLEMGNFSRTLVIDLDLDVNETKIFKLEAPKGTYELTFLLPEQKKLRTNLIGKVVAAVELGKERKKDYSWVVLVIALGLASFFVARKLLKKKVKKNLKKQSVKILKEKKSKEVREKMPVQLFFGETPTEDDPFKKIFLKNSSQFAAPYLERAKLVGAAKKQVSVVACNLRNFFELENLRKKNTIQFERIINNFFQSLIKIVRSYGGVLDYNKNEILIFFLKEDQELNAVKVANELRVFVTKFNEELKKEGIEFELSSGFGVNSGLLAFSESEKVIRYEESETTKISRALSKKAFDGEVLLASSIYIKIGSLINVKRITPLYLDERRAVECFLLQQPSPSEIKSLQQGRVRKFLESL
ncbi:MAG: hypothetical protein NZ889_00580 [Candidatus Pacearchaeota archaeon]|nr:hypothetical protein [Candidatus Pacearchaeota archaeon]